MGSATVDSNIAGTPDSSVSILESSGTVVTLTGAVSEPSGGLAEVVIPANTMGPNDMLRVTALFSSGGGTNSAQSIMRLGGTITSGTIILNNTIAAANTSYDCQRLICNQNSQSTQVFINNGREETYDIESTQSLGTGAVDMSAEQTLWINGVCGAGDTFSLEYYCVEIVRA